MAIGSVAVSMLSSWLSTHNDLPFGTGALSGGYVLETPPRGAFPFTIYRRGVRDVRFEDRLSRRPRYLAEGEVSRWGKRWGKRLDGSSAEWYYSP
jgi:hypothetical protein